MRNLFSTLESADSALLPLLAQAWNINITNLKAPDAVKALHEGMQDSAACERIWSKLSDEQRGALQTLLGSGGKMSTPMFVRLFGEIRKMGAGRIEREKPLENPASIAESLFYLGLIAETFEQADTGLRGVIYVPTDLAPLLPTHHTGYDNLEAEEALPAAAEQMTITPIEVVDDIQQADTSVVDDLTTLLAYLQLYSPEVGGETLAEADQKRLLPHLLVQDPVRLAFLVGVGVGANLIDVQEGRAHPQRAEARRWLSASRAQQVKWLVDAWRENKVYRELWHVPGLFPEPTGWPYDPVVARKAIINFIHEVVPENAWWSIDELIFALKEDDPDFQRPGGDYDSWYIRNEAGDYLDGFESWDAVEGALLEFYFLGPMHWLGLVDLAEDAVRLTAYGRAFISDGTWPTPFEQEDKVDVQNDGTLKASRRVSRIDRFQLSRFTMWEAAATLDGAPYIYKLDAEGIQRASEQGITTEHIASFIRRMIDDQPLSPTLVKLLQTWQAGAASAVTFEQVLILRTTAPETLDYIYDTPTLRRYLGGRLGPMACIIRAGQADDLRSALGDKGIAVEVFE